MLISSPKKDQNKQYFETRKGQISIGKTVYDLLADNYLFHSHSYYWFPFHSPQDSETPAPSHDFTEDSVVTRSTVYTTEGTFNTQGVMSSSYTWGPGGKSYPGQGGQPTERVAIPMHMLNTGEQEPGMEMRQLPRASSRLLAVQGPSLNKIRSTEDTQLTGALSSAVSSLGRQSPARWGAADKTYARVVLLKDWLHKFMLNPTI